MAARDPSAADAPLGAVDPAAGSLLALVDEVRPKTLALLSAVPEEGLLWAPPGTQNHFVWHAGHCLWLADALCVEVITGRSELPEGWADSFGMRGRRPAQTTSWPARAELVERLAAQHRRVRHLISGLSAEVLLGRTARGESLVRYVVHGFHDEANHQGEMYLILKLIRATGTAAD